MSSKVVSASIATIRPELESEFKGSSTGENPLSAGRNGILVKKLRVQRQRHRRETKRQAEISGRSRWRAEQGLGPYRGPIVARKSYSQMRSAICYGTIREEETGGTSSDGGAWPTTDEDSEHEGPTIEFQKIVDLRQESEREDLGVSQLEQTEILEEEHMDNMRKVRRCPFEWTSLLNSDGPKNKELSRLLRNQGTAALIDAQDLKNTHETEELILRQEHEQSNMKHAHRRERQLGSHTTPPTTADMSSMPQSPRNVAAWHLPDAYAVVGLKTKSRRGWQCDATVITKATTVANGMSASNVGTWCFACGAQVDTDCNLWHDSMHGEGLEGCHFKTGEACKDSTCMYGWCMKRWESLAVTTTDDRTKTSSKRHFDHI